jgi:chromosome segregation ATPase
MTSKYYEDVGFRMTEDQYKEYQGRHTAWDKDLSRRTQKLNQANKQISSVRSQLDKEKAAAEKEINAAIGRLETAEDRLRKQNIPTLDQQWRSAQKSWNNQIRIVDPSGHNIQRVIKVPKQALGKTLNELRGAGFVANMVDNGRNLNVSVRHSSGRIRGQELHDMFNQSLGQAKADWYKQSAPVYRRQVKEAQRAFDRQAKEIRAGYSQLNKQRSSLISQYQSQLGNLQSQATDVKLGIKSINNARNDYAKQIAEQKAEYEAKRERRRALLAGGI